MTKDEIIGNFGKKVRVNSHYVKGVYWLIGYHLRYAEGKVIKSVTVSDRVRTEYTVPIEDVEVIVDGRVSEQDF